ncbi:hypothetical protein DEIPH_ctg009orf0023 [Deinococcus phoenicis]|uniref:Peptidase M14 carboxypeptidase A domain-containing protein n=1 Tax=Deinococcus phoenicis TaxID=1476583 RepID=A0A016QTF1_9DEIO|nr:hypothetical protein [Deinococcus phoenicis]EYB69281.1 hypothetical protein DEIPH_ctg009orf0023 [Deinococcus phoenicis]
MAPGAASEWSWLPELEAVRRILAEAPAAPDRLELWVSESAAARAALSADLARQYPGCEVRVRSAYKPLVHEVVERFLPGWRQGPPRGVHLRYPVVAGEHPERFLLEAYPLAGWLAELGVPFTHQGHAGRHYALEVDGRTDIVEVPGRPALGAEGRVHLRPTGRLDLTVGDVVQSHAFLTDAEHCWDRYLAWLRQMPWPPQPPFFGTLRITAELSEPDDPLPYGLEQSSMTEGLSEDLYFGTLAFFQQRAGKSPGNREVQVGQIVPVVRACRTAPPRLSVELLPQAQAAALPGHLPPALEPPSLEDLDRPLGSAELQACLEGLALPRLHARSVQGRPVTGFRRPGQGPGVLVTAGQHGNEATGVVAALRALQALTSPLPLGFIPLENPDGYALFGKLQTVNPGHMHHAARYTALGDDLEFQPRPPFYESGVRRNLLRQLAPVLHLNLHGYPAHEWTRPCSGYVPEGFGAWTLPKGFVLILRHDPAWGRQARELARRVAEGLARNAALMALNRRQLRVYEGHTSARPYQLLRGTPVVWEEKAGLPCPLCLITEFPDETVTGPTFRLGHAAQYEVIRSAVRWAEHHVAWSRRAGERGPGPG